MDPELWAARLSAAKRHLQHSYHQWDQLTADGLEANEEIRPEFSCPYCFEDFDIVSLCSHMEEEHLFESKGVACPVCAVRVPKDMVAHLTLRHGHLFKRRWRFRRGGMPSSSTSVLGKEYKELYLQALLGGGTFRNSGNSASSVADSVIAALSNSFLMSDPDDLPKQKQNLIEPLPQMLTLSNCRKPSMDLLLSAEEREQKMQQATVRARFVQQLVLSSMLNEC